MGGIGGKGKGARRRQKLVSEAKSFDKKTGTFREQKVELVDGKVSREEMLSAPSSFNRFMAATKKAKEQQERRERQNRVSQGLEVSGDGVEEQAAPSAQQTQENPAAAGSDGYTKEKRGGAHDKTSTKSDRSDDDDDGDDGPASTWLRPDLGDGGVEWEEEGARDAKRG
eukprot:CAMPEP_0198689112 /NCGR_PEP_ID=MMETSP1468-20131203/129299_1 /TAXON_ID=1461545 /ORGANISM="Mantoniella sp, Strain CCMP1436" /LENGTH=168 /DNA_ID=CAMNT_0044439751 /DNA_START=151 /DNA_END=653 /DNA_ORIENTATION=-